MGVFCFITPEGALVKCHTKSTAQNMRQRGCLIITEEVYDLRKALEAVDLAMEKCPKCKGSAARRRVCDLIRRA